ncbi:hypothetical protein MNL12_06560 [Bartonella krasnovii]|uniref:hypothetical protein n=1 Tax=Bartonella krasnovii TaxID=2267275 RepID=UPI001F4CB6F4|nr:hypothetical protein [Bartonella krasnovii]UNF35235.1 hypothetical protein MNL12_06560 [Bartonella krasnovii]
MAHFTVTRFYDFTNLHKTVGKRFCDGGGAMMRGLVRGAGLVCGAWCVWYNVPTKCMELIGDGFYDSSKMEVSIL